MQGLTFILEILVPRRQIVPGPQNVNLSIFLFWPPKKPSRPQRFHCQPSCGFGEKVIAWFEGEECDTCRAGAIEYKTSCIRAERYWAYLCSESGALAFNRFGVETNKRHSF